MKMIEVDVIDHGLTVEHNMPCAVCRKRQAVLFLNTGCFEPCWHCQQGGYYLVHAKRRYHTLLLRFLGFIGDESGSCGQL